MNALKTVVQKWKDMNAILRILIGLVIGLALGLLFPNMPVIGLLGSIIPVFAINYIYQKAVEYITSRFSILTQIMSFLPAQTVTRNLAVISIALGVGIGFFGSLITVRRHIRV